MKLIATQTLTSAGPSILFSSIPNNFTDLYVLLSLRMARSTTGGAVKMRINGSDTNFSWRALQGNGSGVSNGSETDSNLFWTDGANQTANTFGNIAIYIPNYAGSTNKSISVDAVDENNATESYQRITAGLWSNTAAITSLSWSDNSASDWVAGTTASLYGIGGPGDGYKAPKATGGVISYSGNYIIHSFFTSGTFTPTANLTDVEYLVVAGGGGGGATVSGAGGGGGGAGGYRSSVTGESSGGGASAESKLSLTSSTAYTITVGAGGARAADPTLATNGTDSSIAGTGLTTISSVGGGRGGEVGGLGGSGGGGGGNSSTAGGSGTANQGFAGGASGSSTGVPGGGGGGAGGVGAVGGASNDPGAAGGLGVTSNITGTSIARAGGGGGSSSSSGTVGGTAVAGGGNGAGGAANGFNATVNTGGGGGGARSGAGYAPGNGGSGIVVVRYLA